MKIFCFYILLLFILVSCRSIDTLSIDYLQPSDISFPEAIKTVAIVDNTSSDDLAKRVMQINHASRPDLEDLGVLEGYGKITAEGLAEAVAEGNYFDQVVICDSSLRAGDILQRDRRLSMAEVASLTNDLQVDMLLSLEKVQVYLRKGLTFDYELDTPLQVLEARVRSVVRLYLPERESPLAAINTIDSLYWVGTWQVDTLMIKEASELASGLAVKHILPTWKTVSRTYYSGENVAMRDAAVCVREDDWEEALQLWKRVFEQKSAKYRMRAAYNIALYYEMHDSLNKSLEWIEKAKQLVLLRDKKKNNSGSEASADYTMIERYEQELKKRIAQLPKLKLQLQRFDGDF